MCENKLLPVLVVAREKNSDSSLARLQFYPYNKLKWLERLQRSGSRLCVTSI